MLIYILRRTFASVVVLLLSSVLLFFLTTKAGDPYADLRGSNADNIEQLKAARAATMHLDLDWYERYWIWLKGVAGCFTGSCDLGTTRAGQDVLFLTGTAAGATMRLVTAATLIAIVIGVALGILTAIRQYSGFDYGVTFAAFLFFSLPVFWAAVLLKEFGAIRYNDWIATGQLGPVMIVLVAAVLAVVIPSTLGGDRRRRMITGGTTFVFVVAVLLLLNLLDWYRHPISGPFMVLLVSAGAAVLVTAIVSGIRNRTALYAALTTAVVGTIAYTVLAFTPLLADPSWLGLFGLFVVTIVVSLLIGRIWGGYNRKQVMLITGVTGVVTSLVVVADILMGYWASFLGLKSRPISTIGAQTPNFTGDFWQRLIDYGTQLILPTVLLALVSIATHSRFTRSSMLEVLNQDYVRTARAKGLSEREVIVKHAFRNSLIPITTIVAFDFATLIGGAVITETVFGWKGMGQLFQEGLVNVDPPPVMAFFLVTGTAAIVMNLIADLAYASLDPRIRR
ncbi:ABC transporter permease [Myceligenerans indicum]|uniref:ABC transporter permease n=1 Tax=Myceligenerans indicum TaxID=2593663 RepID=A0ABS1LFK1_9MICO|nr:ABC transporter permease [Myceligenerans indicum]MBL0884981.1 ABC transporter permease [Myceligenerans indicum]